MNKTTNQFSNIKKILNSFSGDVVWSECTECDAAANFDLEEAGHKCPVNKQLHFCAEIPCSLQDVGCYEILNAGANSNYINK